MNGKLHVPFNFVPDVRFVSELMVWMIKATKIEMTDDLRVESAHECILVVQVSGDEAIKGGVGRKLLKSAIKGGDVKVDRNFVDVMHGSDNILNNSTMSL